MNSNSKPEWMRLLQERAKGTLQKTISEVHYTREVLLAELEEARKMAIRKDQPSAAVSATIGKGAYSRPHHRSS